MDRKKVIKNKIELGGNIRNPVWMTKQFEKGRLFIEGIQLNEITFKDFKTVIKVISEIYEGNWDIHFKVYHNPNEKRIEIEIMGVLIRFLEIEIRNRHQNKHQIKNLFVYIPLRFRGDKLGIGNLQGGRTYLTYAEWQSHYSHSHLNTHSGSFTELLDFPNFSNFCTGSGEINIYMSDINGEGITEERFVKFAMQIMSLVTYESIEGTPYRHMSNISNKPSSGRFFHLTPSILSTFKTEVIDYHRQNTKLPEIDILIDSQGLYEVPNNQKFIDFLLKVPFLDRRKYFCIQDPTTQQYYSVFGEVGYTRPPNNRKTFIFRSENIKVIEIEEPPKVGGVIEEKLHPNLILHIKKELEYELNKDKIRQSTIDRYETTTRDATESVQSDPVLVSTNS